MPLSSLELCTVERTAKEAPTIDGPHILSPVVPFSSCVVKWATTVSTSAPFECYGDTRYCSCRRVADDTGISLWIKKKNSNISVVILGNSVRTFPNKRIAAAITLDSSNPNA